jgi:DNA-binding MarR family transcriptional regulator
MELAMVKRVSISGLDEHLGYWLRFVSNHVSYAFTQKIESAGVTVAEWVMMREMLQMGAAQPSQLAERSGMSRGAISKLVDRLSRKGMVHRSTAEGDRRFQSVELTSRGKKLVPKLALLADQNDEQFFGHLDAMQRSNVIALLQDIARRNDWKDVPVS